MASYAAAWFFPESSRVKIGKRPAGFSSIDDNAISPCLHIASVRGIGVALMASMCGAWRQGTRESSASESEETFFFSVSFFLSIFLVFLGEDTAVCSATETNSSSPAAAHAAASAASPSCSPSFSLCADSFSDFTIASAWSTCRLRSTYPPIGPLLASAARCSTPNRCCSSTTAIPRLLKTTSSEISECVPTIICAAPFSMA
mmetsp:Transcript_14190/g.47031  ORF Transcript_14190/g.47031 Transcript_14190/m.47031 type:complete len:202 (-) Transcript_14190:2914-3519(-)